MTGAGASPSGSRHPGEWRGMPVDGVYASEEAASFCSRKPHTDRWLTTLVVSRAGASKSLTASRDKLLGQLDRVEYRRV